MSTKRKSERKEAANGVTLSKEQDVIARYVRFNCPTNSTMFQGNEVHYFSGSKAVDTLMESVYGAKAKNEVAMLFPNRQAAVNYMRSLMSHQLFFRARKLVPKRKDDKEKKESSKPKVERPDNRKKDEETITETDAEDKKEDRKPKDLKLMEGSFLFQIFCDDKDVYVWVFDPTPLYKKVIGLLMVLGTILGCLFPLWPVWLRQGVYYLSLAGISAFGAIVIVAILRTILFGVIWLTTMGRHKLWILPNLTEDCGFFESFRPWYTYEYCPQSKKPGRIEKKKILKKAKESDHEDESKLLPSVSASGGDNLSQASRERHLFHHHQRLASETEEHKIPMLTMSS
ncbi:translocation protein Sec62 [Dictyocaulus viviparus]|uniref:Translocation protein SEC62 n=1 Tax=Dictyocaulus viviparus TaxID=29172 RepID=A0A0D8Y6X9_DICVI|nr:translocation protein Sec62 [Dictyocaulus viviparus]